MLALLVPGVGMGGGDSTTAVAVCTPFRRRPDGSDSQRSRPDGTVGLRSRPSSSDSLLTRPPECADES